MKLVTRKNPNKVQIIILILVGILAIGSLAWWFMWQRPTPTIDQPTSQSIEIPAETAPPPTLTFSAMGDMLAHDSVVNQAETADGYDFMPYFAAIQPIYQSSDVVFCNPETPAAGAKYGISGYPVFNAPFEFSRDLRKTGCNLINFATNHIADKGQNALVETLDDWQKLKPLAVTGANRSTEEQQQVAYFEKNGIKVAFVALADFSNLSAPQNYSINLYHDEALVQYLLSQARQNADLVIVSAHWGTEDSHQVDAEQQRLAQTFADLGADVVIGTGPHVLQKVSKINRPDGGETLVWYSIGNMLSSQLQTDQLTGGIAQFKVTKADDKVQISEIKFISTFMSYQWSAADRAAIRMETRTDLKLQLLKNAQAETTLFGVTVDERFDKIRQWLGSEVEVTIE